MSFGESLRQLAEQVRKRQAHIKGEEGTKQALVLPFLQLLGFDIYDPSEVQPEYVADFAKKKSNGQFEKVDYALHVGGAAAIFVECKASGAMLEDHDAQLARYFNATPSVKTAIITNGTEYRFFTDLQAPNVLDPTPFFSFDLLKFSERDVELLRPFTKDAYSAAAVQSYAEEVIFTAKVTGLVGEILRNPSENFVRFLLGELELVSGRVTARVVERFVPIVRKAVQTTLLEVMTKSLQQQISPTPEAPSAAPEVQPVVSAQNDVMVTKLGSGDEIPVRDPSRVETTAEEMEIFRVVSKICGESSVRSQIAFKDTVSYFGINLGKVTQWYLRVFANGPRKSVVTRVPLEQAAMLARGFEVEAAPEGLGKSRVYFQTAGDFEKIRALVMVAYEDAVKRRASGDEAGESGE